MEDQYQQKTVSELATTLAKLARQVLHINYEYVRPLEAKSAEASAAIQELQTQLPIILGNVNGICERLDRLEQAHVALERHVLHMLTNTLPSSTDRITQLEHQVKSEIERLENRLNEHGARDGPASVISP